VSAEPGAGHHDEIFLKGLGHCGLNGQDIYMRPPIASTQALINFLFERSIESKLAYTAVFCVMQAKPTPMTRHEIEQKYNVMRAHYTDACALFDAFEKHDKIDADLDHSALTIEAAIRDEGNLSERQTRRIFEVIEQTADYFNIFFSGISKHYKSMRAVTYRQAPNALGATFV
jgi:hypothetical protein